MNYKPVAVAGGFAFLAWWVWKNSYSPDAQAVVPNTTSSGIGPGTQGAGAVGGAGGNGVPAVVNAVSPPSATTQTQANQYPWNFAPFVGDGVAALQSMAPNPDLTANVPKKTLPISRFFGMAQGAEPAADSCGGGCKGGCSDPCESCTKFNAYQGGKTDLRLSPNAPLLRDDTMNSWLDNMMGVLDAKVPRFIPDPWSAVKYYDKYMGGILGRESAAITSANDTAQQAFDYAAERITDLNQSVLTGNLNALRAGQRPIVVNWDESGHAVYSY